MQLLRFTVRYPWLALTSFACLFASAASILGGWMVLRATIWAPLPHALDGVVGVWSVGANGFRDPLAYSEFLAIDGYSELLPDVVAFSEPAEIPLAIGSCRLRVPGQFVSGGFFHLALGERVQAPEIADEESAIVSERLLETCGVQRESARGQTIELNGATFSIQETMPWGFEGIDPSAPTLVWTGLRSLARVFPEAVGTTGDFWTRPEVRWLRVVGTLAPGAEADVARQELSALLDRINSEPRRLLIAGDPRFSPAMSSRLEDWARRLAVLGALMIVLSSLNLWLALDAWYRRMRPGRVVRWALGARPLRLFSESVSSFIGLMALALFASVPAGLLIRRFWLLTSPIAFELFAPIQEVSFWRSVGSGMASAALMLLAIVLVAIGRESIELKVQREGPSRHTSGSGWALFALGLQCTAAVVASSFAIGSLAMSRQTESVVRNALRFDSGFIANLALPSGPVLDEARIRSLLRRVSEALPDGASIGLASFGPGQGALEFPMTFGDDAGARQHDIPAMIVLGDYVPPLDAELLRRIEEGRGVAISADAIARLTGGAGQVGSELTLEALPYIDAQAPKAATVLGIFTNGFVGTAKLRLPDAYVPLHLVPNWFQASRNLFLIARASPAGARELIRAAISDEFPGVVDSDLVDIRVWTAQEWEERFASTDRIYAAALQAVAAAALLIAGIGLGAAALRAVEAQARELAIRAAVGATPYRIVMHVTWSFALTLSAGLVSGGALVAASSRMPGLSEALGTIPVAEPLHIVMAAVLIAGTLVPVLIAVARRSLRVNLRDALIADRSG